MNILIAPDKFKGSLTAQQVCDAISHALLECDPGLTIYSLPLADGGEGSCELLTTFSNGTFTTVRVHDPLGRPVDAAYGISGDGSVAFMEMAAASGLQLLKKGERNPMITSTRGTGQLIRHALDHGVTKIYLGIGGSATNDAGTGMAEALGVQFLSVNGDILSPIGENLRYIHSIDTSQLHPRLAGIDLTIFCDVDNPLFGLQGAAHVFAPQKGADEKMISALDEGLRHYASLLEKTFHHSVNFPGAGAGGGLPASLKVFTSLTVVPGMPFIINFTGLEEHVRQADIILTGEGKIDRQTLSGKVVNGVAQLARKHHKRLIVVAGTCELSPQELGLLGVSQTITLLNQGISEDYAIEHAATLLRERIREAVVQNLIA
jgi:glycerate 2-kinase